jgi:hypothetical protein
MACVLNFAVKCLSVLYLIQYHFCMFHGCIMNVWFLQVFITICNKHVKLNMAVCICSLRWLLIVPTLILYMECLWEEFIVPTCQSKASQQPIRSFRITSCCQQLSMSHILVNQTWQQTGLEVLKYGLAVCVRNVLCRFKIPRQIVGQC